MVTRTQIELISDRSGELADETIIFGVDGVDYEIDLTSAEAGTLRDSLEPFVEAGRRIARGTRKSTSVNPTAAVEDPKKIRAWAEKQGHTVSPRGRVSAEIRGLYAAAHQ